MKRKDNAVERIEMIMHRLYKEKNVNVNALSEELGLSKETIRRDLNELEARGVARRTHGGAMLADQLDGQHVYRCRTQDNYEAKMKIGKMASKLVNDGDTIFLDASTTCLCLAKFLTDKKITIITNSIQVLFEMMNCKGITLISTGGIVRSDKMDLYGESAERSLSHLCGNKAFFSATGFHVNVGATSLLEVEAKIQRTMIQNAETVVFLCDHSKFDKVGYNKIADVDELTYLITDTKLPESWENRLKGHLTIIRCD